MKFINIGTQLRVRPFVMSDGTIRLEVHAERSTGKLDGLGIPQLNAVEFTTNVMVRGGVTVAMGGPIETEVTQGEKVSPFLSSIPYFGCLLCNTGNFTTERQLIMLLTARVVKPQASAK